jgi:hypothetical protein
MIEFSRVYKQGEEIPEAGKKYVLTEVTRRHSGGGIIPVKLTFEPLPPAYRAACESDVDPKRPKECRVRDDGSITWFPNYRLIAFFNGKFVAARAEECVYFFDQCEVIE